MRLAGPGTAPEAAVAVTAYPVHMRPCEDSCHASASHIGAAMTTTEATGTQIVAAQLSVTSSAPAHSTAHAESESGVLSSAAPLPLSAASEWTTALGACLAPLRALRTDTRACAAPPVSAAGNLASSVAESEINGADEKAMGSVAAALLAQTAYSD